MSQIIGTLYKSNNWVIKWSVCGETEEFSQRKGRGRPINLCFWSKTGNDVMIALMMSSCHFLLKQSCGDETSSKESNINLLYPHKKQKVSHFIQELLQFEKRATFFETPCIIQPRKYQFT